MISRESDYRSVIYVGPAGYPAGSKGPVNALELLEGLGLNAMEVQFVRQARMAEEKAREAGLKAKEMGVVLSAHAPYYINFNSPNGTTVRKSADWLMKTSRIAGFLGAWIVVIHAASYSGRSPQRAMKAVAKGLRKCRGMLSDEGIHVVFGLETMGKKGSWGTIEEILSVMDEVEGVLPVVDFGHIHARSGGGLRTVEAFEEIVTKCREASGPHMHCHFSCIEFTAEGERRHLPLGAKEPDFSLLAKVLRRSSGDFTVISETPVPERGAAGMKRILASVSS